MVFEKTRERRGTSSLAVNSTAQNIGAQPLIVPLSAAALVYRGVGMPRALTPLGAGSRRDHIANRQNAPEFSINRSLLPQRIV